MQAFYDNKPSVLEAVGNGSYLYRWDITETEVNAQTETTESESESQQTEVRTQWSCSEVTVWSPVTANKITQTVIAEKWDSDYEQKLVNEYNAAQMGLYGGSKTSDEAKAIIAKYKTFLEDRAALKAQVDADCEELGIV